MVYIIKIDQLVFIKDLVIKNGFTNYKANIILMKAKSAIKILDLKDYEDIKLQKSQ